MKPKFVYPRKQTLFNVNESFHTKTNSNQTWFLKVRESFSDNVDIAFERVTPHCLKWHQESVSLIIIPRAVKGGG